MKKFWNDEEMKIDPKEIENLTEVEKVSIVNTLKIFIREEFKKSDRGV